VTGTYAYYAFGPVRAHTGASTDWTYTGEQNDATGLEYLRARYYDPAIGRFLTQDPVRGFALSPQSLNRYPYVLNNPANLTDPYGYNPWDKLRHVVGKVVDAGECVLNPLACAKTTVDDKVLDPWVFNRVPGGDALRCVYKHGPVGCPVRKAAEALGGEGCRLAKEAGKFVVTRSPACYQRTLAYTVICGGQAAGAAATGAGASYAVYTVGLNPACTALLASVVYACSQ
jgi:RHS repeat-associated protein